VVVEGLDRPYGGVCNIGVRPTVEGREPLLEVHLFDFDGSLYGQLLTVRFLEKIRDEQRFDGLEALQAQIHRDAAAARARWAQEPAP
jgi:riboflavin kinase/FMN adenylyltransferase